MKRARWLRRRRRRCPPRAVTAQAHPRQRQQERQRPGASAAAGLPRVARGAATGGGPARRRHDAATQSSTSITYTTPAVASTATPCGRANAAASPPASPPASVAVAPSRRDARARVEHVGDDQVARLGVGLGARECRRAPSPASRRPALVAARDGRGGTVQQRQRLLWLPASAATTPSPSSLRPIRSRSALRRARRRGARRRPCPRRAAAVRR